MKKYIIFLLSLVICSSTINYSYAKSASSSDLASAIRLYKAGNYAQCYTDLQAIIKKDPSNAVAYYYLAMSSSQIGKKEEAIENYDRVLSLSPNSKMGLYSQRAKTCLEAPTHCHDVENRNSLDAFVKSSFGSGFSDSVRSDYEKNKIENMMREMNRNSEIAPSQFKEYKDFSSYNNEAPTSDEIVAAMRVLQKAGFSNIMNQGYSNMASDISLLTGSNGSNGMLDLFLGGKNANTLSPQLIQTMLTGQLTSGF